MVPQLKCYVTMNDTINCLLLLLHVRNKGKIIDQKLKNAQLALIINLFVFVYCMTIHSLANLAFN